MAKTKRTGVYAKDRKTVALNVVYTRYLRRSATIGVVFDLTRRAFHALTQSNCHYCGCPPAMRAVRRYKKTVAASHTYNGLDRIDNTKGYTCANTVACCWACNSAKGFMSAPEFYGWLASVLRHRPEIASATPAYPRFRHPRTQALERQKTNSPQSV